MSAVRSRVFPLVPRRRFVGAPFGDRRSARRGGGDEPAGSRPYHPGDNIATIDWKASARRSAARGTDEFVVREFFAEEAVTVALVCDRRPSMRLHEPPLPWLSKADALVAAGELIVASTRAARASLAYVDLAGGTPRWTPPQRSALLEARRLVVDDRFDAPQDAVPRALRHLCAHAGLLPAGTFVFVVSDFLGDTARVPWARARALGWDLVPVVVQDPVWEQSFPDVGGVVVPFADPATGRPALTRLSRRAAGERARANAQRLEDLFAGFRRLGFDRVLLSSAEPEDVAVQFRAWARRRRLLLRRGA
jgi:uncharacterized protein (DUF58 family)